MYYKDSLRYRQGWLGIATLLILLFHFPIKIRGLWVVMTPTFINKFRLQAHSNAVWIAGVGAVILGSLILKQCIKVLDRYSHKKARTIS